MAELYSKFNRMEDNYETKQMLLFVWSFNQVICDMVFRYRNYLLILTFIDYILLGINNKYDTYELELLILS